MKRLENHFGKTGKRNFEPFPVGSEPEGANLRILKLVCERHTKSMTVYRVKRLCCGQDQDMSHQEIYKRMCIWRKEKRLSVCLRCAALENGKRAAAATKRKAEVGLRRDRNQAMLPELGFYAPTWPVPKMALQMHRDGWEGR